MALLIQFCNTFTFLVPLSFNSCLLYKSYWLPLIRYYSLTLLLPPSHYRFLRPCSFSPLPKSLSSPPLPSSIFFLCFVLVSVYDIRTWIRYLILSYPVLCPSLPQLISLLLISAFLHDRSVLSSFLSSPLLTSFMSVHFLFTSFLSYPPS